MIKFLGIIVVGILVFNLCNSYQKDTIYLLFEEGDAMKTYYTGKDIYTGALIGGKKYLYQLSKGNVIFETETEKEGKHIELSDTVRYEIHNINWIADKTMQGLDYYSYQFFRNKKIGIAIVDTSRNKIKLIPVVYVQEVD